MLLLVLLLSLQVDSGSDPALHDLFLGLENRLVSGLLDQDPARVDALLADEYVLRGRPDIDRETWIRNAVTLCWGDRSDIEEFSARRTSGAVIVSFVLTLYQDPNTCAPATVRSLITDVWARQDGEWLLAVRHSGPIGDAGADPIAQQFLREDAPPPRWENTSELSFVSTGGNADVQTLGLSSQLIYRPGEWETSVDGSFVRSIAEGIENARSLAAQVRQSAEISDRMDLFSRGAYRRDLFAGIEHRWALDAGLGYDVLDSGGHRVKIDTGLGYLIEQRAVGPRLASAILNLVNSWQWQVIGPVVLGNDASGTLPLDETDAWRATNELSLTTRITDLLSVKLSHTTNYLNTPVPGFGQTDTVVSAALVTTFEKR